MQLNSIVLTATAAATLIQSTDPSVSATESVGDSENPTTLSASGTGAGNVDGIYRNATLSIVSGTPVVIDLTNLHDINGNAITVANLVGFKINHKTGMGVLTYGGGANPVMAAQLPVEPGGKAVWDGIHNGGIGCPVASGTKNLQLTSSVGTITATITLFTRSA